MNNNVIILTGPTASGKSQLAIEIANILGNIVILNADSMQIYEEIPIVSAQPSKDDQNEAEHRLYGVIKGNEPISVGKWLEITDIEVKNIQSQGKIPLIVGGTTMYIRLLCDGLSHLTDVPDETSNASEALLHQIGKEKFYNTLIALDPLASCIKYTDKQRLLRAHSFFIHTKTSIFLARNEIKKKSILSDQNITKLILMPNRETIYTSCNNRFIDMINTGGIEEIESLIQLNYVRNLSIHKAIGVPEIVDFIESRTDKKTMIALAQQHTRNYAKRQMTWLRNKFQDFQTYNTKEEIIQHLKYCK